MQSISTLNKKQSFLAALLILAAGVAVAGTTGTEFQAMYTTVVGWASGFLGKTLAIAAFLFGVGAGVAKQTVMPAALGIVFALVMSVGPGIIDGIVSAVI